MIFSKHITLQDRNTNTRQPKSVLFYLVETLYDSIHIQSLSQDTLNWFDLESKIVESIM